MLLVINNFQQSTDVKAFEEDLYGSKIGKKILHVPVVKLPLQAETTRAGAVHYAGGSFAQLPVGFNVLHLQRIGGHDMITVARRVRPSLARMEESQHHASGFEQ